MKPAPELTMTLWIDLQVHPKFSQKWIMVGQRFICFFFQGMNLQKGAEVKSMHMKKFPTKRYIQLDTYNIRGIQKSLPY